MAGALTFLGIALVTLPIAAIPAAIWIYRGIKADDEARARDRATEMRARLHQRGLST